MINNNKLMSRRKALQIIGGATIAGIIPYNMKAKQSFSLINDTKKSGKIYYAYRSFWPELETTSIFKKEIGVNTRCFFASNTINGLGFEYCKYPLIWKGIKNYDFSAYDKQVEDLISANPEADFMCMIDLNTPYWLTRRFAYDSFSEISHAASDKKWIEITTEWMKDFISYSEGKYGGKIIAYILSGGGTSEWYEYDRGRSSSVKNTAWREWCARNNFSLGADVPGESLLRTAAHENVIYDPETEMHKIQYWRFHNEVIADAILHFAKEARSMISRDKEIGIFFGYYLVSSKKLVSFGHLDYERVFASPNWDFVISPGTYDDRAMGDGSGSQLVFRTAERYGKRYLHEIDHGTHVAPSRVDWKTQEEDIAGLKREAFFSMINHLSLWWFDMWGGWYKEKETQQLIKQLKLIHDRFVDDTSSSIAEVLLIADPQSAYYINEKEPQASAMAKQFRDDLNKTGTPFDVFSFNDIPVIDLSRYKVVFLPATLLITPERETILKRHILNNNRTVVWVYAPGICNGENLNTDRVKKWTGIDYGTPGPVKVNMNGWKSVYSFEYSTMTPSVLKEVIKDAGVHMYTDEEIPVYANERLLTVHFKEGGKRKIHLPKSCKKVVDVYNNKVVARNCREFN
ncbi:MAG: hypothetical protein ACOX19_06785 [Fermentimonas sp.]